MKLGNSSKHLWITGFLGQGKWDILVWYFSLCVSSLRILCTWKIVLFQLLNAANREWWNVDTILLEARGNGWHWSDMQHWNLHIFRQNIVILVLIWRFRSRKRCGTNLITKCSCNVCRRLLSHVAVYTWLHYVYSWAGLIVQGMLVFIWANLFPTKYDVVLRIHFKSAVGLRPRA